MATMTDDESAPPMPWTKRAPTSMAWLLGGPAGDGGEREQRHSGQEHLLAAHEVAQAAGHEEEAPEGDEVGVDDPGQPGLGEVQAALDVRERHVDDGAIERVHEHGQADDHEGYPAPAVGGGAGRIRDGHGRIGRARAGGVSALSTGSQSGNSHDFGTILIVGSMQHAQGRLRVQGRVLSFPLSDRWPRVDS